MVMVISVDSGESGWTTVWRLGGGGGNERQGQVLGK